VRHYQKIALTLIFFLCFLGFLSGQEASPSFDPFETVETRTLGSQIFQIDLGLLVPLFSYATELGPGETDYINWGANLSLGGAARIRWSAFVNNLFAIGFDIGGSFAQGPNSDFFSAVIIGPRFSAVFRQGIFQFPISITPGLSLLNYSDGTYAGFALKPELGAFVDIGSDWALGINLAYEWLPEVYLNSSLDIPSYENRVGNLLDVSLSLMYSF